MVGKTLSFVPIYYVPFLIFKGEAAPSTLD